MEAKAFLLREHGTAAEPGGLPDANVVSCLRQFSGAGLIPYTDASGLRALWIFRSRYTGQRETARLYPEPNSHLRRWKLHRPAVHRA